MMPFKSPNKNHHQLFAIVISTCLGINSDIAEPILQSREQLLLECTDRLKQTKQNSTVNDWIFKQSKPICNCYASNMHGKQKIAKQNITNQPTYLEHIKKIKQESIYACFDESMDEQPIVQILVARCQHDNRSNNISCECFQTAVSNHKQFMQVIKKSLLANVLGEMEVAQKNNQMAISLVNDMMRKCIKK